MKLSELMGFRHGDLEDALAHSASSLAFGRAAGAALGALCAAAAIWLAPLPIFASAVLFAAVVPSFRTMGGWLALRRLRSEARFSFEWAILLARTLRELGVQEDYVGVVVARIAAMKPRGTLLNDPAFVLGCVPAEAWDKRKDQNSDLESLSTEQATNGSKHGAEEHPAKRSLARKEERHE
jgi:hypothetical protein